MILDKDTKRRFKLFGIGVLLGSVLVYFMILKDRNIFKGPQEVIFEKMKHGALVITDNGRCRMNCKNISEDDVKNLMTHGDVNYSESQVHEKPCPFYAVDGKSKDGREIRVVYRLCTNDSLTEVITAHDLSGVADTCACK